MRIAATNTRLGCSAMPSACRHRAIMLGAGDRRAHARQRTDSCSMTSGAFTTRIVNATEFRAFVPPCGRMGPPPVADVSNASCAATAYGRNAPRLIASAPLTAGTACRWRPIGSIATLPRRSRTRRFEPLNLVSILPGEGHPDPTPWSGARSHQPLDPSREMRRHIQEDRIWIRNMAPRGGRSQTHPRERHSEAALITECDNGY